MSRTNLLLNRKPIVNIPITARSSSNLQLINKNLTYRNQNNQDHDEGKKLYTFCASQNKPQNQEIYVEDDTQPFQPQERERKTSINMVKGKIFEPQSKSKPKVGAHLTIGKEKKKNSGNFSMLNNSNIIDRRKTQKPVINRQQDKKINISICINKNGLKQKQDSHALDHEIENVLKDKTNMIKQTLSKQNIGQTKEGWNIVRENGKNKIIIEEDQLSRFTCKLATQKWKLQEIIQSLTNSNQKYKQKQVQWQAFKKDSDDYIQFLQKEKKQFQQLVGKLKQQIKQVSNDKEYYALAKEEHRQTIKTQQKQIQQLKKEINDLKNQLGNIGNVTKQSIDNSEYQNLKCQLQQNQCTLKLFQIQNIFLIKQLQNCQKYKQFNQSNLYSKQTNSQNEQIKILSQKIIYLNAELQALYKCQFQCQIFKKTLQHCTQAIDQLQQQCKSLRKQLLHNSRSIKGSSNLSEFQFVLDSSRQKGECSPSEVQVIWRRQMYQQSNQTQSQHIGNYFDINFFQQSHRE